MERVGKDYKLLFAGPGILESAFADLKSGDIDKKLLDTLVLEYNAMRGALMSAAGKRKLVTVDNLSADISAAEMMKQHFSDIELTKVPKLFSPRRTWPRDAHTQVGGKMIINEEAWYHTIPPTSWPQDQPKRDCFYEGSIFGEGGAVLARANVILASDEVMLLCPEEAEQLNDEGFLVESLPLPGFYLPGNFARDHLDGHSTLVASKWGDLALLIGSSFYNQGREAADRIEMAVGLVGIDRIVVDDKNLPHLAFNLNQFDDTSVVMTRDAEELEKAITDIVGKDAVIKTDVVIDKFPKRTRGSLRCLSNVVAETFLSV